ncbi:MAG TPA: hypothetical protein GX000_06050 [Actinomyces sp.]|nr:hypothetical protein [Actinomyces sp.]
MPLFEFDDGRLIPAQFGRTVRDGLTDDILKSVREQVLEIVGRPLFPITWQDSAPVGSGMDGGAPRLTALDASGQVVSVEVVERLDSTTMIDSLSRLADTASLGWNDLAAAYPGGIQGFRMGWAEFRDAMPPSPAPGPRLILVAGSIADTVRPALDVLASSGVEVHEIAVRAMSNGRKFIDVQAVGPRLYGHNPNLLLGRSSQTLELTAFSNTAVETPEGRHLTQAANFDESTHSGATHAEAGDEAPETPMDAAQTDDVDFEDDLTAADYSIDVAEPADSVESADAGPAHAGATDADDVEFIDEGAAGDTVGEEVSETTDQNYDLIEPGDTPEEALTPADGTTALASGATEEPHGRHEEPAEQEAAHDAEEDEADIPQLKEDSDGLHVIGQILGQDTPIVWQRTEVEKYGATLTPEGEIRTANWSTGDPDEAAAMVSGSSQYSGWEVWHLGDPMGPSLREALGELNREIRDEYETVGSPRRGRRSRRAR